MQRGNNKQKSTCVLEPQLRIQKTKEKPTRETSLFWTLDIIFWGHLFLDRNVKGTCLSWY